MSSKKWQQAQKKKILKKDQLPVKSKPKKKIHSIFTGIKSKAKKKTNKKTQKKVLRTIKFLLLPVTHPVLKYVTAVVVSLFIIGVGVLLQQLPSPRRLTSKDNFAVSTLIYDRRGELLYEIFDEENRVPIKLEDLPPSIIQATIAIEDKNFYHHWVLI